jgi:hypothetical protein
MSEHFLMPMPKLLSYSESTSALQLSTKVINWAAQKMIKWYTANQVKWKT